MSCRTAGWLAAYIMSDFFYSNKLNANVKVIESLKFPTIGVGEKITKNVLDNSINDYAKKLVQSAIEIVGE